MYSGHVPCVHMFDLMKCKLAENERESERERESARTRARLRGRTFSGYSSMITSSIRVACQPELPIPGYTLTKHTRDVKALLSA